MYRVVLIVVVMVMVVVVVVVAAVSTPVHDQADTVRRHLEREKRIVLCSREFSSSGVGVCHSCPCTHLPRVHKHDVTPPYPLSVSIQRMNQRITPKSKTPTSTPGQDAACSRTTKGRRQSADRALVLLQCRTFARRTLTASNHSKRG